MANNVYKIGQKVSEKLNPVEVNEWGDKIYIDINDTTFVNKVINLFTWFDGVQAKIRELNTSYESDVKVLGVDLEKDNTGNPEFIQMYHKYNVQLIAVYKDVCAQFDIIFGEGTIRKYFRALYEAYGDDFVPDDDCIEDFIEEIIPVVNQLFTQRKIELRKKHTKKTKAGAK